MKKYIWGAVAAAVVIVVVMLKSDAACSYFPSQIAWINECKTVSSLTPIASDEANKPIEVTPITIEPVTEEPFEPTEEPVVPTEEPVMGDENKDTKTVETSEVVASEEPATENSAEPDEVIKPTFDLARVEADGSAVVAGRAIPNAIIILKNSGEIIAETTTNETGEWVAIVNVPVSDDVIELTIDSIAKDGVVTSSDEEIKIAMRKVTPTETTVTKTPVISPAEETAAVETSEIETPAVETEIVATPVAATETVDTAVVETAVSVTTPTETAAVATIEGKTPVVAETNTEEPKLEIKIASVNNETPAIAAEETPVVETPVVETPVVETPVAVAKTDEPKTEIKVAAVEAKTTEVVAEEIAIEETTEVNNTPLVLLTKKGEATKVLQGAGVGTKGNEMTFNSLDYNENGEVIFSGDAKANEFVRVYINNQFIGQTKSDATGRWSLDVGYVMKSGKNDMRFDQVEASGAVISRRVTTITMPILEQKTPQNSAVADNTQKDVVKTDESQIVVEEKPKNTRAVIVWGDSLWNISQEIYGDGELYIAIFEANKRQIRNPDLIFPGQVFMLPDDEEIEVIMAPLRG